MSQREPGTQVRRGRLGVRDGGEGRGEVRGGVRVYKGVKRDGCWGCMELEFEKSKGKG